MMIWRCELHHKANVRTMAVNETAEKTVQSAGSEDGSYNPKELVYERTEGTSGSWGTMVTFLHEHLSHGLSVNQII